MDSEAWKEASAELGKPLDGKHVKSRSQAGRSVSYIESWMAISEANRIFGFNEWNSETVDLKCVAEHTRKIGSSGRDGWGISYIAKVRVTVGTVVREGVGAGHGIDVDAGQAHESAIKEAESDARKRALMTFGNPFGLALYDKTQANVDRDAETPVRGAQLRDKTEDWEARRPPAQDNRAAAPAAATPSAKFNALKESLELVGHENALNVWVNDVKAAVDKGQVTIAERGMLQTMLARKRSMLAQRPAA